MDSKLQELTSKIYNEGIEKANNESKIILENAEEKAKELVDNAQNKADDIILKAKQDAEQLNKKALSEIKMAGDQALTTLKQNMIDLLSQSALSANIKSSLDDEKFLKELIAEMISKWDPAIKSLNLDLILPEKSRNNLETFFKKQAADILKKGVELKFHDRMDSGFKIGPKDNSFVLSFTDKDFEAFFQSFLKPKIKEILFPQG